MTKHPTGIYVGCFVKGKRTARA
ncbi:hypothetical protein, partial [Escherichia coli]